MLSRDPKKNMFPRKMIPKGNCSTITSITPRKYFQKEKKEIVYTTKEQRQQEIREILKQLSKFELTPRYEPVKELSQSFMINQLHQLIQIF